MTTPSKKRTRAAAKAAPLPTFSSVLAELAGAFEIRKRHNGEAFTCIRDDAPEWTLNEIKGGPSSPCLALRIHEAVDDRGPDDWIYEHIARTAERMQDHCDADTTGDALREGALHEIVDGMVDAYNADLTRWLASHLYNIALCDEAVEEMGAGSAGGVLGFIQAGQYRALEGIANAILAEVEGELARRLA